MTVTTSLRSLLLAVLVCFGLAALSQVEAAVAEPPAEPPSKELPIAGEVFAVDGHTAFLILPPDRDPQRPTPWVWYAPTLPHLPGVEEKWMFDRFLAAGIAIGGVDVGESFGSPQGRAVYTRLHKQMVEKRGLAPKACLLVRSRGGLMLYNWAAEHAECVACIAGIYPVCDLRSWPGPERACGAYGKTADELAGELSEHNPVDRLRGLAEAKVPIFHIHGNSDTVVPLEKNSGEVARRYRRLGGTMALVVPKNQGHNMWPGFFRCQKLVDFVLAHADDHATQSRRK